MSSTAGRINDIGPQPQSFDIESATKENTAYRSVAWSGRYLQVTLMSIPVGGDIGLEAHPETDQFLRESPHIVGDVLVGNLGPKVAALEPQDDRLVDRPALGPVVFDVSRGNRPPDRPVGTDPGSLPAGTPGKIAEVKLPQLVRGLPDMSVTINNHKVPLSWRTIRGGR